MQKRTNDVQHAGLFTADLFGNVNGTSRTSHVPTNDNSRTTYVPRERKSRTTSRTSYSQFTESEVILSAVYPFLDIPAYAMTMDNYRIYVSEYNELVQNSNELTENHNHLVQKTVKEGLNEVQKEFSRIFLLKNKNICPWEFNKLVDEFTADRGYCLKRKKIQTIKFAAEGYFANMIHKYSVQISEKTNMFMKLGIVEQRALIPFEVNSYHIANLYRNGVRSVDSSSMTIKRYRKRFEEAGILCQYKFKGHKRGVDLHINPQILVVFDAYTSQYTFADNQFVTPETVTKCTDNNEALTRTNKINIKIKENVKNNSLDLGTAQAPEFSNVFYKNIAGQCKEDSPVGRAENVKVLSKSSENLKSTLLHEQELAVNLASGQYNYYKPIDICDLEIEARNGTMTREEFKCLIIQDFMKSAARLYRSSTPYVGSWKKAINSFMDTLFISNHGLYRKDLMVDLLQEFRWRLNSAHKWFSKYNVNTLYPGDYFDFTRTEAKEVGFAYTKKAWLKHKKYEETKAKKAAEVTRKAKIRKEDINNSKKYDEAIKKCLNKKITTAELFDYVKNNLPKQFQVSLSDDLLKAYASKNMC